MRIKAVWENYANDIVRCFYERQKKKKKDKWCPKHVARKRSSPTLLALLELSRPQDFTIMVSFDPLLKSHRYCILSIGTDRF